MPFITDDNVLQVVLNSGFRHPAYKDANIPTVDIENAIVFNNTNFLGIFLYSFIYLKFCFLGLVTLSLNCLIPILKIHEITI